MIISNRDKMIHQPSNPIILRDVINKVVHDPEYKSLSQVPLFSFHQIGLTILAYVLVLLGVFLAYSGVTLWIVYPIMIFGFYTAFTPLHDASKKCFRDNGSINYYQ
tara:strand:- start:447 stop:764 length:318 start_codon:yes stop_codon:yes gene_type:complete